MDSQNMSFKYLVKSLINETDSADPPDHESQFTRDPRILGEYRFLREIWNEAGKTGIFEQFSTQSDWEQVRARIGYPISIRYRRISWQTYFLRIAAVVILTLGLTYGFYRLYSLRQKPDSGFITLNAVDHFKEIILPDGSSVALKAGSELVYRNGFGELSREVILNGEAFFNVLHNSDQPFRVYINGSVVEVTGTQFSVREESGSVTVSVLSGTVLLSSQDSEDKITISANQSGFVLARSNELGVEEGIPVNNLSWKTGYLVFEETPIDSALMDIARHFGKELSIETHIAEEITAEFQNQPLHEILEEIQLVAGIQFDTTGIVLTVRK